MSEYSMSFDDAANLPLGVALALREARSARLDIPRTGPDFIARAMSAAKRKAEAQG
jgi:hypothetical protein